MEEMVADSDIVTGNSATTTTISEAAAITDQDMTTGAPRSSGSTDVGLAGRDALVAGRISASPTTILPRKTQTSAPIHPSSPSSIPPLAVHAPSLHIQSQPSIPPLKVHAPSLHAPPSPAFPPLQHHAPSLHIPTGPTFPPLKNHAPSLHIPDATRIPPLEVHAPSLHAIARPTIPPLERPPPSLHITPNEEGERSKQGSQEAAGDEEDECERGQQAQLTVDERLRRDNMSKNASLLVELGLSSSMPAEQPSQGSSQSRRRRPRKEHRDRWGHVLVLPEPGARQRMACVEIRPDRKLNRAIDAGQYYDLTSLTAGEERRWRFGDGEGGTLVEGEESKIGEVGEDFRWRIPSPEKEVAATDSADEEAGAEVTEEKQPRPPKLPYSELPGVACHQCKRKTQRPKMECRNINPKCNRLFCDACCKRYSYFVFDEEDRSFMCPVCMGMCNCAYCLKKRKLSHLVGDRFGSAHKDRLPGETVQEFIDRMCQKQAPPPFDRVRLVTKAHDIQSPPLPEEWQVYIAKQSNPHLVDLRGRERIRKRRSESAKEGAAKEGAAEATADGHPTTEAQPGSQPAKKIKLKVKQPPGRPKGRPKKNQPKEVPGDAALAFLSGGLTAEDLRHLAVECTVAQGGEKVVDSDGDTIDGYSDITPYSGPGAPRWDSMSPPRSPSASPQSEVSANEAAAEPVVTINEYLAQIHPQQPPSASATPVLGTVDHPDSASGGYVPTEDAGAQLPATVTPELTSMDDGAAPSLQQSPRAQFQPMFPEQHALNVDYVSSLDNVVAITPEQALMESSASPHPAAQPLSDTPVADLSRERPSDLDSESLPQHARPRSTNTGLSQTLTSPMKPQHEIENERLSFSNERPAVASTPGFPVRWGERTQTVPIPTHSWAERPAPPPIPPSTSSSYERSSIFGHSDDYRQSHGSDLHLHLGSHQRSPTRGYPNSDARSQSVHQPLGESRHSQRSPDSAFQRHLAYRQRYTQHVSMYHYERREQSPAHHDAYSRQTDDYQGNSHGYHDTVSHHSREHPQDYPTQHSQQDYHSQYAPQSQQDHQSEHDSHQNQSALQQSQHDPHQYQHDPHRSQHDPQQYHTQSHQHLFQPYQFTQSTRRR